MIRKMIAAPPQNTRRNTAAKWRHAASSDFIVSGFAFTVRP
jgi:hypothetical protein